MQYPIQVVVVLDVASVAEAEILPLLPDKRHDRIYLRLSHVTGRSPGDIKGAHDWDGLARGVAQLAEQARASCDGEHLVHLFVAGRAPLPLFVQLGYSLSKLEPFADVRVLNPDRGGPWTEYPMAAAYASESPVLEVVTGLEPEHPSVASGWVAVFVSTIGTPAVVAELRGPINEANAGLAGLVELRSKAPLSITPENSAQLAKQLAKQLPQVTGCYPTSDATAMFVAGPVPLAFAVGRALNENARPVHVMNYTSVEGKPTYELAVSLPMRAPHVGGGMSPQEELARVTLLNNLNAGIDDLRRSLLPDDLAVPESSANKERYVRFLKEMKVPREPKGTAFELSFTHRELQIGRGLLDGLMRLNPTEQGRFVQQFILHELFHDQQNIRSTNYHQIGRAAAALEELDYWADTMALHSLVRWSLRRGGIAAEEGVGDLTVRWIDVALRGVQAFDQFEQGEQITRLYERRLRRYLIWHLQQARAATVRSKLDVERLFQSRLVVELAPLQGALDGRQDKLVMSASSSTEFFAVCEGRLVRMGARPNFKPQDLVDAVRAFRPDDIREAMRIVVEENRSVLAPWTLD